MTQRNKEQSMGVTFNEALILQPGLIEAAMRDLGRSGFGIARLFMRNTNFTHRCPQVVDAVARAVAEGHRCGVRVVLDCEPHVVPVAFDMGKQFPSAMGRRLVRAEAELVNGRFLLHVPNPVAAGCRAEFLGVEAAWLQDVHGLHRVDSLEFTLSGDGEIYETGFTTNEHYYVEGRAAARRMHSHLRGYLKGSGRLIVYALFSDKQRVDFWAEGCRAYYDALLECYRGIPLDGVAWDEPATAGDWDSYLYGDAFAAAFERLNGYRLADRMWLLDEPGVNADSVLVRLDYYRTLNEGMYQAQRNLNAKAKEFFGPDLIFGTHHTWQGEGGIPDSRAGAVDYFRLNENMDAGYTDCCWWDVDSVCYVYTLASSLGRLTSSGEAEVNTWHWKPTNSLTEYNARLMTLLNVTWFNIFYGESSETCLYPAHYTWEKTVECTKRNRDHQRLLGKARPVVDIAILHGWETVAVVNRPEFAGAHKTFCMNTARLLMDRSIAFDWIDSSLLSSASIQEGCLKTSLESYRVLVLPYASVLPREAWVRCKEFAQAGGTLIFVGPPPSMDTDGAPLDREFAELLEMPQLTLDAYLAGIDAVCTLPKMRSERLQVCYPLNGAPERLYVSPEGEPHGIRNGDGNVHYLSDLDPRDRLVPILESGFYSEVQCFSDSMLWRLYREGDRSILVLVAHKERTLSGIVRYAGRTFELNGGTIALIESDPSRFTVHGDALLLQEASSKTQRLLNQYDC